MEREAETYLAKAAESLASAESDYSQGRYNSCANSCYYACFQAAVAALLRESIRPHGDWSHKFVQGQVVGQLIDRRKRYRGELRRTLPDNLELRELGDYQRTHVTRTQAHRALARTRELVSEVEARRVERHG